MHCRDASPRSKPVTSTSEITPMTNRPTRRLLRSVLAVPATSPRAAQHRVDPRGGSQPVVSFVLPLGRPGLGFWVDDGSLGFVRVDLRQERFKVSERSIL